ncbi:MAG: histidine--tRNA ligase [Candidatus Doudnabacteria bacterium]
MTLIEPRLLKGFRDFAPQSQARRQQLFAMIRESFEIFGFAPLETPVLEYKDILMGKYGDDEKLVYSFKDNGDRDVAMRYDLTVPLARFVALNQGKLTFPFKRYQIAPVWRADNPQKGRYREFYQCDVDVVGSDSVISDVEVIACLAQTIEAIGLTNYKIRINDRAVLKELSQNAIRILDKVEKIGVDGMINEMRARDIDTKEIELATKLVDPTVSGGILNDYIPDRLQQVLDLLQQYDLKGQVEFDPTIARGLDYYSGTVFEIFLNDKPEYGSICSGGRYDGLLDQFSKQSQPAVGGSIGIDRLLGAMEEISTLPAVDQIEALIVNVEPELSIQYIKLANRLRELGIKTEVYCDSAKLEKQFKYGEQRDAKFALVFGSNELEQNLVQLKNLQTREQQTLTFDNAIKNIVSALR